ncbi:hypothetical protein B296_00012626 [Ensete ventricosum]|uniref:Uncharacterized protein n=1 Tax=Ensete ventricosum TaxID=4639 RepID=A0A426ZF40_ENSVE|nr:hypothetical protein B296_00012626 [Ensete ventricosum]
MIFVASGTDCADASCLQPLFSPSMISRAGQMSSASSHFESHLVKILARRSRVLGHPSEDSRSTIILSWSGGTAPIDFRAAEALATMRFLTEWTSQTVNNLIPVLSANEIELVEILQGILSTSRNMNEVWLAEGGLSPAPWGPVEVEEAPERGYTIWDLCEVEDRAGAERYFASIMMRLKTIELGANQELVVTAEHQAKELEEDVKKLLAELESLKNQQKGLELEASVLRSGLDGARDDRTRLEGDVLSLTEATTLLETELKAKWSKAVDAYKASRGFESCLEKMGRVSYEFGYRVALDGYKENIRR